ncbi:MAG: hypothetical protein KDK78_09360, partial [Chlamydiia bacterium]|nr:hypothetical protein [Chlamydiia bacterium]
EFVHDHIYHIVPLLRRIFSAQADQYAKSRNELVDGLSKQIACIAAFRKATPDRKEWADQAEKLTAMLLDGTLVIDSWSSWPERPFSHSLADQYMVLMKHPEWMNYWNCRYGPSEKKLFVGFQSVEKFHASTSSPTAGSRA